VCEGESVYTCGCCPDCGLVCGSVSCPLITGDDPIDFDDDSDNIGPEDGDDE
jgi:hypothetical protein